MTGLTTVVLCSPFIILSRRMSFLPLPPFDGLFPRIIEISQCSLGRFKWNLVLYVDILTEV